MVLVEYIVGGIVVAWLMFSVMDFKFDKTRTNTERESIALLVAMVATIGAIGFIGVSYGNVHIKALALPFTIGFMGVVFFTVIGASAWLGGKLSVAINKDKIVGQWVGGLLAVWVMIEFANT